jgi:hypothetical protein
MVWPTYKFDLWHGTDASSARDIVDNQVRVTPRRTSRQHLYCDFGPGFYTTPNRSLAEDRARQVVLDRNRDKVPMLVHFTVDLHAFASLKKLAFANGGEANEMFWSFVHCCRNGADFHDQVHGTFFPAVLGPVVGSTGQVNRKKTVIPNAEQVSFHGNTGIDFINQQPKAMASPDT